MAIILRDEEQGELLGGEGVIVEIDESKFGKMKYHKGLKRDGLWVFGAVERNEYGSSKKMRAITVCDRSEKILGHYIKKWIKPGSIIYSDKWRSYSKISKYKGYKFSHKTVNHEKYFKDPETGVHTNTIEGMWKHLKSHKTGTGKPMFNYYFYEFAWRRKFLPNFNTSGFDKFLIAVSKVYNP